MAIVIILIVVAVLVPLNIVATWKAQRSIGLRRSQKTAQTILTWIVPFLGAIAVIVVSTHPRDRKNRPATPDPGADVLSGGGYFGGDGGGHYGSHGHGHGHGGDAGHGGDGGAASGDGGGGH